MSNIGVIKGSGLAGEEEHEGGILNEKVMKRKAWGERESLL